MNYIEYIDVLINEYGLYNCIDEISIFNYNFHFLKGMNCVRFKIYLTRFEKENFLFIRCFGDITSDYRDYLFHWDICDLEMFNNISKRFDFREKELTGCCYNPPIIFVSEHRYELLEYILKHVSNRNFIKHKYKLI
jgi:hypothetical protein